MPGAHAILSPSASKRWMNCTPSARLEAEVEAKDTVYTKEGTHAHAVAEIFLNWCVSSGFDATPDFDHVADELHDTRSELYHMMDVRAGLVTQDGFDFWDIAQTVYEGYVTIVYAEYLAARMEDSEAELITEATLTLGRFIPEGFGSSDAVIIADDKLRVFDLKYGRGVKVDAVGNSQMMIYALGALYGPGEPYLINWVEMTIVQPRLNHVSSYMLRSEVLSEWGRTTLKPIAEKAFKGEGDFVAGEHCRFCRVAARCRALARYAESSMNIASSPELMNDKEVAESLERLDTIKSWAEAVESYALEQCLDGKGIPGWKAVEGRSVRKIADQTEAVATLVTLGWDEEQCYKPREIRPITELEKMVGKKNFPEILGKFVQKTQGKPTLVRESDKRPPYSSLQTDFKGC